MEFLDKYTVEENTAHALIEIANQLKRIGDKLDEWSHEGCICTFEMKPS